MHCVTLRLITSSVGGRRVFETKRPILIVGECSLARKPEGCYFSSGGGRLGENVEYRPVQISHVIREINRSLFLPAIQREFEWEPERVEKLFDSIMGDYPIGSFLFWKIDEGTRPQWTTYEFFRDFDKEHPHNREANLLGLQRDTFLVLDGQQRLTALYVGLRGSYRHLYYKWHTSRLYLNLFKLPLANDEAPEELIYQFQFRDTGESDDVDREFWYLVGNILVHQDPEDAKAELEQSLSSYSEAQRKRALSLVGRLHARIHTYTVINYFEERSQDPQKVLNIFVRANSGGIALSYSDLLLSVATAKWRPPLNARDEVYNFMDELNGIGPGYRFDKDFILKGALYLTDPLPIQYLVKNFTAANIDLIQQNWDNIKKYLATAVHLIARFGFNNKNLVAPLAVLPISYFLMKRRNPKFDLSSSADDAIQKAAIKRWIIVVLLKNAFGSSTDRLLKSIRDLTANITTEDAFPFAKINEVLGITLDFSDDEISNFLRMQYQGRYTYLVLSLLYPDREWKGVTFHEDHIFPKSAFDRRILKRNGYSEEKIDAYLASYNSVVNLQLITDSENREKLATPFDRWLPTRDANFRQLHLIPELSDYSFDHFDKFVEARRALIVDALRCAVKHN